MECRFNQNYILPIISSEWYVDKSGVINNISIKHSEKVEGLKISTGNKQRITTFSHVAVNKKVSLL